MRVHGPGGNPQTCLLPKTSPTEHHQTRFSPKPVGGGWSFHFYFPFSYHERGHTLLHAKEQFLFPFLSTICSQVFVLLSISRSSLRIRKLTPFTACDAQCSCLLFTCSAGVSVRALVCGQCSLFCCTRGRRYRVVRSIIVSCFAVPVRKGFSTPRWS